MRFGLKNVEDALAGRSEDGSKQPKFQGFGLFGPTRLLLKENTDVVVPGITEILPNIKADCPKMVLLGVLARPDHMWYHPGVGLIIRFEDKEPHLTILHPQVKSNLILQQSVDVKKIWHAEWQECARLAGSLIQVGWPSLLLAYNGSEFAIKPDGTVDRDADGYPKGGVVESEIRYWAEQGWPVLLVKGSLRVCDKLANDARFLEAYPSVDVAENNVDSIRAKLFEKGMLDFE